MEAIYRLAWLKEASGLVLVNWRDMETEELGSVYESLLELTPRLTDDGRGFAFAESGESKGHARKTTGSYYTPDSLVQRHTAPLEFFMQLAPIGSRTLRSRLPGGREQPPLKRVVIEQLRQRPDETRHLGATYNLADRSLADRKRLADLPVAQ